MNTLIAHPTEYRGVRFRSKSEAVFARNLDLSRIPWRYEPEFFRVEDWVPDFYLGVELKQPLGFMPLVLEFKPGEPTETYMDELLGRYVGFLRDPVMCGAVAFGILAASPFDSERERFFYQITEGDADHTFGWTENVPGIARYLTRYFDEALKFRFDLAGG